MFRISAFIILFFTVTSLIAGPIYDGLQVNNINIDGNTISSTNTGGDLILSPNSDLQLGTFDGFLFGTSGVVSAKSSIDLTSDVSGVLPIANGGTNSSTALNNDFVMISSGGAIVEDSNISVTELNYLDGVTSNLQTQIDNLSTTLQDSYDASTDGAIVLDGTRGSFQIQDASTPIAAPLFQILSNDELTSYFEVQADSAELGVDLTLNTTGALTLPVGTEGERPTASTGMIRFNSTGGKFEGYNGTQWGNLGGGGAGDVANVVTDPSFENEDAQGTCTNCTISYSETNLLVSSETNTKHLSIDFASATTGSYLDSYSVNSDLDGHAGYLHIYYKTSRSDVFIQTYIDSVAGSDVNSECELKSDGEWHYCERDFIYGSTNVGYKVDAQSASSESIEIEFVYVGLAPKGRIQSINNSDTDWISFTPTGSWSNTTYSGLYKRVGDDVLIKYKLLLTGTPSGLLSLELPNSLIVDENKVVTTGVSNYVGYGNAIETGASSYHIASRYRTDNDNIDVVYWNSSTGLTAALGATGLFTFGNTDEITIEMRLPIQGWSTGRTEVVNQQTELTAETANELSAIINMSTDTVTSSNYDWIDSVSTPVTGDLQIDISSLGLTQVPSCTCIDTQSGANTPVDCVDDQDNPNTTSTLYFALIQGNGNGVDINNVQINCSKQGTDVNKSIELLGKFKLKKCQKKYLTSDITATTADVTDLKFENLDTSKTYEMTGRLRFVFSGTTNCSINVSDGTNNVLGLFDALSDTVPPTDRKQYPLSSSTFTPSSNTLTTTLTESGTCTFEGDGTVGETYLELCEYQSMVVSETSEW